MAGKSEGNPIFDMFYSQDRPTLFALSLDNLTRYFQSEAVCREYIHLLHKYNGWLGPGTLLALAKGARVGIMVWKKPTNSDVPSPLKLAPGFDILTIYSLNCTYQQPRHILYNGSHFDRLTVMLPQSSPINNVAARMDDWPIEYNAGYDDELEVDEPPPPPKSKKKRDPPSLPANATTPDSRPSTILYL